MLFDEPTSALDPEMVSEVLSVRTDLARNGMTMMCVTHEMGFARNVADTVWLLEAGTLSVRLWAEEFFSGNVDARIRSFIGHTMGG